MRTAQETRKTKETDITIALSLDGGAVEISTGIGFFDHMLTAFAVHGGFGLQVKAVGDLYVDGHHTVEDTGIVLGKAFAKALGDKSGIARFGSFYIPMDEALAFAPYSKRTCSVIPAFIANARRNSSVRHRSYSPVRSWENSARNAKNGLPLTSTAANASASSIGM